MQNSLSHILEGMDQTQTESPYGWWETSTSAEFGRRMKLLIIEKFYLLEEQNKDLKARLEGVNSFVEKDLEALKKLLTANANHSFNN